MEHKSLISSFSSIHLGMNLAPKPLTPSPNSKALKLAGTSILASRSTNHSPVKIQSELHRLPKITKQQTIAYTDWEMYNANREKKETKTTKNLHNLRRNIQNPKIYINGTDVDQDEQLFESYLLKAFKNIHQD